MHVGGVRTALFAWLLAKQSGGKFILRIEDTDKVREVEGSIEHIINTLNSLGLNYDEGPDKPGNFGPYKQSERLEIYKEWANKLVSIGRAYADPYTKEQVEEFRNQAKINKKAFLFRQYRPENPPLWDGSMPLRFLSEPKEYSWHDEIMGELKAGSEAVDDFILMKSDGYPTYNFAHIVDDYLMEITHIIRSQEFLASVPRYLNLYEALQLERPLLATVPFVLAPDGKKKLSKRDGAKDVLEYTKEGYLPETLLNFMASLGWNDGTTQEIFTVDELINKFKLSEVQKSGARFDEQRLTWMNGSHIRELAIDDLYKRSMSYWPSSSSSYDEQYKKQVLALIKERLKFLAEIPELTNFFFEDLKINSSLIDDNKKLKSIPRSNLKDWLLEARASLEASDFSVEDISSRLNDLLIQTEQKPAVLFSLIRIATTQSPASPGLFETLEVLGKERVLSRIDQQIAAFT
jgi:glutamyl-tRNA synthetase